MVRKASKNKGTDANTPTDAEILAIQQQATKDLAAYLKALDIEVDYAEADWRDGQGLAEGTRELLLKHPHWHMMYMNGDTWGIDSNFVFVTSKPVEGEVIEKIGDFVENLGAEIPLDVIPKCPHCGIEVAWLKGSYTANVEARATLTQGGSLSTDVIDGQELYSIIDIATVTWYCPGCDWELFVAGQEDEMIAFFKCDEKFVWKNPREINMGEETNVQP